MTDVTVTLTTTEVNIISALLRDSAQAKQSRARQVDPNNRADMEASAMRDYELRKKFIGAKVAAATRAEYHAGHEARRPQRCPELRSDGEICAFIEGHNEPHAPARWVHETWEDRHCTSVSEGLYLCRLAEGHPGHHVWSGQDGAEFTW